MTRPLHSEPALLPPCAAVGIRHRSVWPFNLPLALLVLVASIASSQEPSPGATNLEPVQRVQILESVEVTARREALRKAVDSFVSTVTRADRANMARWRDPICPLVAGAVAAQADFVKSRLEEVANSVRARVNQDAKCKANLLLFFTTESDELVERVRGRSPGIFSGASRNEIDEFLKSARPVRVWHSSLLQNADGTDVGRSSSTATEVRLKDSRITSSVIEEVGSAIVVVDTGRTGNATLGQLADYIAMVTLAQVDPDAEVADSPTILKLFTEPRPKTFPTQLTDWDYAFLKAVYGMSDSVVREKRAIAARMTQDLEHLY